MYRQLQPLNWPLSPDAANAVTHMFSAAAGVYVEEGSDRDALTAALSKEGYIPVYLDEKTVHADSRRMSAMLFRSNARLRFPMHASAGAAAPTAVFDVSVHWSLACRRPCRSEPRHLVVRDTY